MEVAILYSGGKDSTLAIEQAMQKRRKIKYLISIKPTRTDCYLFHFATVEQTRELSKILRLPHIYAICDISDPEKEAEIIKNIVKQKPVEAVILGGVGLQGKQIKAIRDALFPLGIEVFASHKDQDNDKLVEEMINKGYKIVITEIAVEGLTNEWLGKILTKENFNELKELAKKYGFHSGGEGGHYNTLVVDGPIFDKKIEILESEKVMETKYSGYLLIKKIKVVDKLSQIATLQ